MPNWVENLLVIDEVPAERLVEIKIAIAGLEYRRNEQTRKFFQIRRAIDFQKIIQAPRDYELFGEDPQDWRSDNWGTKWNSLLNVVVCPNTVFFLTAWDPPLEIIMQLSQSFPDAKFSLSYSSESNTAGIFMIKDMEINHEHSDDLDDKFGAMRNELRAMKHKFKK
jgi:hypothetical protein